MATRQLNAFRPRPPPSSRPVQPSASRRPLHSSPAHLADSQPMPSSSSTDEAWYLRPPTEADDVNWLEAIRQALTQPRPSSSSSLDPTSSAPDRISIDRQLTPSTDPSKTDYAAFGIAPEVGREMETSVREFRARKAKARDAAFEAARTFSFPLFSHSTSGPSRTHHLLTDLFHPAPSFSLRRRALTNRRVPVRRVVAPGERQPVRPRATHRDPTRAVAREEGQDEGRGARDPVGRAEELVPRRWCVFSLSSPPSLDLASHSLGAQVGGLLVSPFGRKMDKVLTPSPPSLRSETSFK